MRAPGFSASRELGGRNNAGSIAFPASYVTTLVVAGALWTAAFATYAVLHAPILLSPRVDGRPG